MTITTRFYAVNKGKIKANCSICIDEKLVISGFTIAENKDNELFVSFPSTKLNDGTYKNTVYCLKGDYFKSLSKLILDNYLASIKDTI